jgi:hypothetical protein
VQQVSYSILILKPTNSGTHTNQMRENGKGIGILLEHSMAWPIQRMAQSPQSWKRNAGLS